MNLYYCQECTRIFNKGEKCPYCEGQGVTLKKNAPVNVIGTKIKGRILKQDDEKVILIIRKEDNSKITREYLSSKLRKIL